MQSVHLICNAHIDPVWLWEWEEGAAEAISTFRTAAEFCETYPGFVFNHNEAILYRWVEEYEPALFRRIQRLVARGAWHIMGGWYIQPDCNMPSGESFVRQILLGRTYFQEKFGVTPTTAINFDPFGHTRGLVQILAKSGYDSYIICRPLPEQYPLPAEEFRWEGYDGSSVAVMRSYGFYRTPRGKAAEKVVEVLGKRNKAACLAILWGIGNHGGGPSRIDLEAIGRLREKVVAKASLRHSTPEAFFAELKALNTPLPVHRRDLNPCFPGCYTSQIRIKQKHRLLENELYSAEKMAVAAWQSAGLTYPADELAEAGRDLATAEFHDILPGTSIQPVEEGALRLMDHGLEILSRVKARAFFALAQGQPKAAEGEIPLFIYNPHPYPVPAFVECEFQLADDNRDGTFTDITVHAAGGRAVPTQVEKELSSVAMDWRKRVVFPAVLAPSQINRFVARTHVVPAKPAPVLQARDGRIRFRSADMEIVINAATGLIDRYRTAAGEHLQPEAFRAVVAHDSPDAWGMQVKRFGPEVGAFRLMSPRASARFSGVAQRTFPAVRVIEDGAVRSVVEAVFSYRESALCLRYKLPKAGTEFEVEARVYWHEKDRLLKLSLPTRYRDAQCRGQVAFGSDWLPADGTEAVAQKWIAVTSATRGQALSVVNDGIYGFDCGQGELRLSLVRSPAYAGHPIEQRPIVEQDRLTPRIDQGERLYRFWIKTGPLAERLDAIDREALARNERPMALSFFPAGADAGNVGRGLRTPPGFRGRQQSRSVVLPSQAQAFCTLSDDVVQVTALKRSERGDGIVLRLFEPTGAARTTTVAIPSLGVRCPVTLGAFEIKTLRFSLRDGRAEVVDLCEQTLPARRRPRRAAG